MKLSTKQAAILKSYLHGLIVAVLPLAIDGETNPKWYLVAVASGVVVPALRALDKNDSAFGIVADAVEAKVATVAPKVAAPDTTK